MASWTRLIVRNRKKVIAIWIVAIFLGGSAAAGPVQRAGKNSAYNQITTPLENQDAADRTKAMRKAIGHPPGIKTYLSGFPAINDDTEPIYNDDLARGETIAIPIALAVLVFMF